MLYFLNDYSEGAHEKVLQHLIDTNMEQLPGYGTDHYCEEAKEKIKKQLVMDMSEAVYPENPVVPFIRATQDRVVLEIQRGCIRGCRHTDQSDCH